MVELNLQNSHISCIYFSFQVIDDGELPLMADLPSTTNLPLTVVPDHIAMAPPLQHTHTEIDSGTNHQLQKAAING